MQFNIIDILYFTFIFPLQFSLGIVLDYIFALIKSQGFSIIALSLLVNIFLLKIFILADRKASKVNAIKARCDSKIAEFRRVFKGAELQSYIRTLYKQRHYHPIFALSSLGGLALQVPFFIAVFCLLQEVKWLENASFLWIEDLSKADSVLGVHILPILMTIITLINVFISSKEKGARIQGSLIALIFLALLYNMPSALVLYWTTNMVFALGRAVVKAIIRDSNGNSSLGNHCIDLANFEHSQTHSLASHSKFAKNSTSTTANTRILGESQGDSAKDSGDSMESIKIDCHANPYGLSRNDASLSSLRGSPQGLTKQSINENISAESRRSEKAESLKDSNDSAESHKDSNIMDCHDLTSSSLAMTKKNAFKESSDSKTTIDCHANPCGLSRNDERKADSNKALNSHNDGIGAFPQQNIESRNDEATPRQNTASSHHKIESDSAHYLNIAKLAIITIGFLVFIFNPFSLYATDINQFDTSKVIFTICGLVGFCGLFCGGLIYLVSFIRTSKITAFCACFALLLCLIYSFVLVGDYGAMDNFILQNPAFKDPDLRLQKYLNALIAIAVSGGVALFFLRRFSIVCKVASLTMILLTGGNAYNVFSQISLKYNTNLTLAESSADNPLQSTSDSNIQIPPPITLMCHIKTNSLPTTKRKIS